MSKVNSRIKLAITASFVFTATYLVYLLTAPHTVYWQDSGIYLVGIKTLGIVYPPGYPLYIFFGWLWVKLLTFMFHQSGSFAYYVHSFSAFFGSMASAVIVIVTYKLCNLLKKEKSEMLSLICAGSAGLFAGFSYSLWAQSINAEVYSLVGFFTALEIYCIVRLVEIGQVKREIKTSSLGKWFVVLLSIWGLSFANHLVSASFLPVFIWLVVKLKLTPSSKRLSYKHWIIGILLFIVLALLPYSYLPLRSSANPDLMWKKIDSVKSFIDHVTGSEYYGRRDTLWIFARIKLSSFPELLYQELLPFGLIISSFGLWVFFKRKKEEFFKLFAVCGLILGGTIYLMAVFYHLATEYKFWLIPFYLFLAVCYGVGLYALAEKKSYKIVVVVFLSVLSIGSQLFMNWPFLQRKNYTLTREYGINYLGILPKDAILFTLGDQETSIPLYLREIEGFRKDIVFVDPQTFTKDWQMVKLQKEYPDVYFPSPKTINAINKFIQANYEKRHIFAIGTSFLQLETGWASYPEGAIWKIVKIGDTPILDLKLWDYKFSDPKRYEYPERREMATRIKKEGQLVDIEQDTYANQVKDFELQAWKNLGDWCFTALQKQLELDVVTLEGKSEIWKEDRLKECAKSSYQKFMEIDPEYYHLQIYANLALLYKMDGESEKAKFLEQIIMRRESVGKSN